LDPGGLEFLHQLGVLDALGAEVERLGRLLTFLGLAFGLAALGFLPRGRRSRGAGFAGTGPAGAPPSPLPSWQMGPCLCLRGGVLTVTWLTSCHIQRISMARKVYQMIEPQRRCGGWGGSFGLGGCFDLGVWSMQKSCMRERTGRRGACPPGLIVAVTLIVRKRTPCRAARATAAGHSGG